MDIEEVKAWRSKHFAINGEIIDWLISEHDRLTENCKLFAAQNNDNAQENSELRETNRRQWEEINRLTAENFKLREEVVGWYTKHGIGYCGHHGYQSMPTEDDHCPMCALQSATLRAERLERALVAIKANEGRLFLASESGRLATEALAAEKGEAK
jgi:hypothetical protein